VTTRTPPAPADGTLGVLTVGLGAVATTFIAGVELMRKGLAEPIGTLTEMATVRLGRRDDGSSPTVRELVPLAELADIRFGAWDPFPDDAFVAATRAGVLDAARHLEPIAEELRAIEPMQAAFDADYVKRLDGTHVIPGTRREMLDQVRADIAAFREREGCDRMVMVWCGSTEIYIEAGPAHATIESFEAAIDADDHTIAPSMIYAYAAILEGVPFANGAPNLTVDAPCLRAAAELHGVAISGKDFKTGQTLIKTALAPMFKARMLGVGGWFSTNILGNRDGEVLDDPDNFRSKEVSKLGVLEYILQPDKYPALYGDLYHKVRINYYPPRGDDKEGWDNIDLFGWLGYRMQIKVDFLCKDSILAAPLVLDLALFMDLAQRSGMTGIQEWLSFYYKSPQVKPGLYPEHDLFIQLSKLKNTLRWIAGEDQITHLGVEYYAEEYGLEER
jgi:myo-inositol-1-phosphate synthase